LAAFLLLSGILARLQAIGINSPNDTRFLLDQAILTLENMLVQDSGKRGWLSRTSSFSQVEEKASARGSAGSRYGSSSFSKTKVAADTRSSLGNQKSNASAAACEFAPKLAMATLISADHSMGAAA